MQMFEGREFQSVSQQWQRLTLGPDNETLKVDIQMCEVVSGVVM